MQIAFDAKRAFQNFTGLGNYSRNLIQGLATAFPSIEYHLFTPCIRHEAFNSFVEAHPRMHAHVPHSKIDRSISSLWRSLTIHKELQKLKPAIYHGLSGELPLKMPSGIKQVVTVHDLIFMRYPEQYAAIDRKLYVWKHRKACQQADRVIAISQQTKEDIVHFLGIEASKIEVIYQSCSDDYFSVASQEKLNFIEQLGLNGPYILNVSSFNKRKNQLKLLQAYHNGSASQSHQLVLVGNGGDYLKEVEAYINKHALHDKVRVFKDFDPEHLPALYQAAAFFVYPSFFEGFGIPIVEAQASGKAVVTSHGSCFKEVGGLHSIYVDPNSVESIGDAIDQLAINEEKRESMEVAGAKWAQQFTLKQFAEHTMQCYQQLTQ